MADYIIRKKRTELFLPIALGKGGRGSTHQELAARPYQPRIFNTLAAAKNCLRWWLKGKTTVTYIDGSVWDEIDPDEEWHTEFIPERRAEDMEIVAVEFVYALEAEFDGADLST